MHLLVKLNIYYFRDFGIEFKILGRKRLVILADFFFLSGWNKENLEDGENTEKCLLNFLMKHSNSLTQVLILTQLKLPLPSYETVSLIIVLTIPVGISLWLEHCFPVFLKKLLLSRTSTIYAKKYFSRAEIVHKFAIISINSMINYLWEFS